MDEIPNTEAVADTEVDQPEAKPKKAKKSKYEEKYENLCEAARLALQHYEKTHSMKTPNDYNYPGFKQIWEIINS